MSEFQRANSFGTGYLDTDDLYKVKIENKSRKRFFEIAGDEKAMKAFGELPTDIISYHWDKTSEKTIGKDGKDYFHVEIGTPEGDKMLKIIDYKAYMKLITKYNIVSEGKWKEWKQVNGKPQAVRVQE